MSGLRPTPIYTHRTTFNKQMNAPEQQLSFTPEQQLLNELVHLKYSNIESRYMYLVAEALQLCA